jgi:hypothetical protein
VGDRGAEASSFRRSHWLSFRSIQLMPRVSPSSRQPIWTRPAAVDSAPYLPALVASSWTERLGRGCVQVQRRAADPDPEADQVGDRLRFTTGRLRRE